MSTMTNNPKSQIFTTYASPEQSQQAELDLLRSQSSISYRLMKPEVILLEFKRGRTIENLAKDVYRSGVFKNKTLAKQYVQRVIYEDIMISAKKK